MPEQKKSALALKAAASHGNGLLEKLLAALPPDVADTLLAHATSREVTRGETLVERGTRSEEIGYVLEGTLAMVQTFDDGKKHIIGLLIPTDIYGGLFNGPSNYRIEALSPARILSFERTRFEQLLRENPVVETLFLVHLQDEVDAAREWLLLIGGRTAINRLTSFLTILVRRSHYKGAEKSMVVRLPLTRKDLADYLGTRPETVSRAFHELQRSGVLRIIDPYCFEILDTAALLNASGDNLTAEDI